MHPNLSNRFLSFHLSSAEQETAKSVNPYFLAYLQNKIAAYANAVVEESYEDEKNQIDSKELTLIRHERLKAQVLVLEELFMELKSPEPTPEQADQRDPQSPL
jgi:hypothetical protein